MSAMQRVSRVHRRCALLVAGLHPADRAWLLRQLGDADAGAIGAQVDALQSWMGQDVIEDVGKTLALRAALPAAAADAWSASACMKLATSMSPEWLARILACLEGAEREFCVQMLDEGLRARVVESLGGHPALPPALQVAIQRAATRAVGTPA